MCVVITVPALYGIIAAGDVQKKPSNVICGDMDPDVWFEPEESEVGVQRELSQALIMFALQVWEVMAADLSISPGKIDHLSICCPIIDDPSCCDGSAYGSRRQS
jgi:hypothetical protein